MEYPVERLFEALISGDRPAARAIADRCLTSPPTPGADEDGPPEARVVSGLFWPVYELIDRLHRSDQISNLSYHLATRLLRVLVDQSAARRPHAQRNGRRIFAACGPAECEELAAQMTVDLLEAAGFEVTFAGGGVPADEIQAHVQEYRPDVLLLFASAASDLPGIRGLIDQLREVGASGATQIVVGGGVFNRAEGLAEEIGADQWAADPRDVLELIQREPQRRATESQRTVGKKRPIGAASTGRPSSGADARAAA